MIRMFQSQTSGQAKGYFRDALSKADYYIEDQEHNGVFNGLIAKRLGIENQVIDKATFEKLCDNINPQTGKSLTPRTLDNRRVGYDISFHCPKSVSILHALGTDTRVLTSFEASVSETMREIESDMQTRIRLDGQNDDRLTGELLWTNFVHQTARPVEGHAPDPHLHCHCYTFNVTYDEQEQRFKAGQFHNIKRDMPYYQARFQKRLADKLANCGYGIRKTRNGFEVAVVPQKAIDYFSKRTNLIGQVAKEKGITNKQELDQLGAKTRAKKQKNRTMTELQDIWRDDMNKSGITSDTAEEVKTTIENLQAKDAIDYAIDHSFTRKSVLRDRQVLSPAYLHAVDNADITLDEIDQEFAQNETIFKIDINGFDYCTTQLVHAEERRMIALAREGLGKLRPLNPQFKAENYTHLNKEQHLAMEHILHSQDRVTMIVGGAGTGKTTLFKNLVPAIEQTGKTCFLFAPTAEASRDVLQKEGFENADTVARLLLDKKLQEQLFGQVIIVDEAGMLGSQDMARILDLADAQQARVILSGDPKQHTAVMRGDAMRLLRDVGKIPQVSLEHIYRQKNDGYKSAVKQISRGNIKTGFAKLNDMQAIRELDPSEISQQLVNDYLTARGNKKSALVVTPTVAQMKQINLDIRESLQKTKQIGKREKTFTTYHNLHLTLPEKSDYRSYSPNLVIQTYQNMPSNNGGIKKGEALTVTQVEQERIQVTDGKGTHHILPLNRAKDYDVFKPQEITISKGDEIRIINKNGSDMQGRRLNNRTHLKVTGFTPEGDIKAQKESKFTTSEFILSKAHGNFDYAYAMTSYSAQGKTVDQVFISQPAVTFPASHQQQFYVSVSRARENVTIYTDDKEQLLKHIEKSGDRQGATELVTDKYFNTPTIDIDTYGTKEQNKDTIPLKDKSHEPEL